VTVLGYGCANSGFGTVERITLLGATTSATANDSTAIGYGATATLANQIMLGRTSETVYCPGTVSLVCSGDVKLNGSSGTVIKANGSTTEQNLVISNNATLPSSGARNIQIGNNIGGVTTGSNNTCLGAVAGTYITTGDNNTAIGYNALYDGVLSSGGGGTTGNTMLGSGASITSIVNYSTSIGYNAKCGAGNSVAIGYDAVASLSNQIIFGTLAEFVECAGTSTTNGCLKLNGGLKLQTAYGAVPSATMLGYRIELSAIAISSLASGTSQTIGSLALTVGVWSLNYTFELLADGGVTTQQQSFFFSNASGSSATYATRRANTGTTRFHSNMTYANTDNPAYSGGGTYYASAAITLYPAINITFSTGALTGTGYASAVRIG
jgi:hypothetical protein